MRWIFAISFLVAVSLAAPSAGEAAQLPDDATLRSWVQAMKEAPRGPFERLRWFCNDGTILPPKEYACREHGGGVQHGQWTDRVKLMRDNGYYIANVYADINPETFQENPAHLEIVKQMILERFLMEADNGWIFRKARYYRGALQTEDENRGGRSLLLALAKNPQWTQQLFVVLREAVRFLPHGRKDASITEMRQLSLSLAEQDPNFETLRIKIHVQPELSDADDVRTYAKTRGVAELSQEYERLAAIIEAVFRPQDIGPAVVSLAKLIKNTQLKRQLNEAAGQLRDPFDPAQRFAVAGRLLATLRDSLPETGQASRPACFAGNRPGAGV